MRTSTQFSPALSREEIRAARKGDAKPRSFVDQNRRGGENLKEQLAESTRENKELNAHLRDIEKRILEIRYLTIEATERALTGKALEQRIWEIWAYVRENQGSLDSGMACAAIHRVMTDAVADVQIRLEAKCKELERLNEVKGVK